MMRRLFCLLLLVLVSGALVPAATHDTVRADGGVLAGVSTDSVVSFKGIPFAAPPVGNLRWRAPQPAQPWQGVRRAADFSASCMQNLPGSHLPWTEEFMTHNAVSEDCLYLNVWTSAKSPRDRRPVIVWFYGGGFVEGSAAVPLYDGAQLAREGAVFVSVNYRLGVLGFLAHPELTRESGHNASGNYAYLDAVAALQWVQRNIAAFGGDPKRVTIAGQSAGSFLVHAMMISPLAKGLFQRVIANSGPEIITIPPQSLADAEKAGVKFAASKNAATLAELRAIPARDLLKAPRVAPIVDGWVVPQDEAAVIEHGKQNDTPLLNGSTADEFTGMAGNVTAESYEKQARQTCGELATDFLNLYPAASDEQAAESRRISGRDRGVVAVHLWAGRRAKTSKSPEFTYVFTRAIPWPEHPEYGAFHSGDLPYFFNNLELLNRPWEAVDHKLAEAASRFWVQFAAKGNPNPKGASDWHPFNARHSGTMELGAATGWRVVVDAGRFEFWRKYFNSPVSKRPMF